MDERELDDLMQAGLASYSAEPDAGLKSRILAATQSTPMLVGRSGSQVRLGIASAIAATVLLGVFLTQHRQAQTRPIKPVETRAKSVELAIALRSAASAQIKTIHVGSHFPASSVRARKVTYTPPSMSPQEERLVALAMHQPEVLKPFIASDDKESKPLSIEPLSTPSIASKPLTIEAIKTEPLLIEGDETQPAHATF